MTNHGAGKFSHRVGKVLTINGPKPPKVQSIEFLVDEMDQTRLGWPRTTKKHLFCLGLGPCKETVESLAVEHTTFGLIVRQVTEASDKTFVYPWSTIASRVVTVYSQSPE